MNEQFFVIIVQIEHRICIGRYATIYIQFNIHYCMNINIELVYKRLKNCDMLIVSTTIRHANLLL